MPCEQFGLIINIYIILHISMVLCLVFSSSPYVSTLALPNACEVNRTRTPYSERDRQNFQLRALLSMPFLPRLRLRLQSSLCCSGELGFKNQQAGDRAVIRSEESRLDSEYP